MIKVWNRTTTLIETIEEKDYDSKIHFHRNTHEPLNIVVKVEPTKLELLKIEATEKGITFAPNI
tara:strand:+ start:6401 stop:6592 length:192 start_codon:yes stop_codon:yes gene_type:complete